MRGRLRWIVVLVLVAAAVLALRGVDLVAALRGLEAKKEELGLLAPLGLGVAYVLACVMFVPGAILTLGAGALFGLLVGSITVSLAATAGATAAFLVGRYLVRDWVAAKVAGNARFAAVDEAVGREGFKIVLLTRLSPVFPFNLLNYAYALTGVSLRDYVLASWLGMIPGTIMYVYVGTLFGDVAALAGGVGERERTPAEWALLAGGLVVTVVVTVYVTRIARRALDEATGSRAGGPGGAGAGSGARRGDTGGTET